MENSDIIIQPQRLKRLTRELVNIYSPSGKEEDVLHFLYGYMKRRGLPAVRQDVDDNRYNLLVSASEPDISLALIGHVDTVVAYDLEDYSYSEQDGIVSGLGTADMKCGCAAMVEAFMSLWEAGCRELPVSLCLVVGEEEEGDGAERLIEDHYFPWAIIGEPTNLRPCLSNYGYLEIQICTFGQRMHASLAHMNHTPVETMLRLMLRLSHYIENERPDLIYNIRDIFSTQAGFVVPDRCEAWLDVHLPPGAPIGEIATEMEEIVAQELQEKPSVDGSLRIVTIDAGYELPEKGQIVESLKTVYMKRSLAWEPDVFRSHSDANQLWAAGVKTILLGPGKLDRAHAPDESIPFDQVCLAAQIYLDLLLSMAFSH